MNNKQKPKMQLKRLERNSFLKKKNLKISNQELSLLLKRSLLFVSTLLDKIVN